MCALPSSTPSMGGWKESNSFDVPIGFHPLMETWCKKTIPCFISSLSSMVLSVRPGSQLLSSSLKQSTNPRNPLS
ncbi:hypothetical protein CEXT_754591 [Caerostris extrusa]|uniref:Uncharacterized protein n=1 Tax=Caerostris extrusa TaxID=172846 RepID=A0AAV4NTL3_CAEEX|nr:hypothetical protein CEXT_754591 [Caerostris extrusa]